MLTVLGLGTFLIRLHMSIRYIISLKNIFSIMNSITVIVHLFNVSLYNSDNLVKQNILNTFVLTPLRHLSLELHNQYLYCVLCTINFVCFQLFLDNSIVCFFYFHQTRLSVAHRGKPSRNVR